MIQFAICDDDVEYLNVVAQIICDEFNAVKTFDEPCRCILYKTGEELIDHFIKDNIDIVFLDIECGGESGFDIAKKLVKQKKELGVVYITNYQHYISSAFVCRPLGFICKNAIKEDIKIPMINIVEFLEDRKKIIYFHGDKGDLELSASDIIAVEVFNHKLQITLTDKTIEYQGQLSKYEPFLVKYGFIKIARGILVNKKFIIKINGNEIYLVNSIKYTISRRRVKEVVQMWRKADVF